MTELINSLKVFATTGTDAAKTHLRNVPLMALGRMDSCSESGFNQWRDAMRMVARLPGGLPPEFRIRLWENLADRYLFQKGLDWSRIIAKARGGDVNFRHQEIADQIDKDLHRTGCTGFSGAKQAVLKEVLVAYAKWNPSVGYCQGFNMIGAMLLQMTSGDKELTLKVFVYLIEGVLPQGYFSQGLRGLAVDMAVFRELLKLRKPTLNSHLARLQNGDDNPPLTDVFTMHWFLTLFIHCLPTASVLRIWDLVLLEGSEVLLRAALVLWAAIETRISCVRSADEFYSVMGVVTREMLEFGLMDPNTLVKCIVSVGPFPFPGLEELRGKHRALISQDTPYKSFFLAKRELDNLKRHYTAIRHRQRATTIILKNLEPKSISGFRSSRNLTHSNSNSGSGGLSVPGNKKAGSLSPKPKPRRLNSGGKSVILGENNNRNVTPYNNNKGKRLNQNQLGNKPQQQITLPWDSSTKKPKNFRQRQASASSSYSSSSSSSSTELCDSSLSEDDSSDTEPEKQVKPPKKEEVDGLPSPEITKTKDEQMDEILDQEGNRKSRQNSTNSEKFEQNQIKNQEDSNEPDHINRSSDNDLNENKERNHASAMAKIPTINLSQEDATPADLTSPNFEPPLDLSPKSTGPLDPDESEQLQEIIHPNDEIDPNKVIDTNDSQHFLEEMSRLGKSDSFYENLSHRICQLQFQNLRILTTCNTIPDPVIMPNIDYSPLPSPMSPVPPRPLTPNLASSANLNVPFQRSKLVLSPSLNHLSLSTSRRSSLSSNASQPGSPMLNRSPIGSLENSSKSPSRRHSKSSMSSQDTEEGVGHLSKMNSSSIENDVVVPAVTVETGLMSDIAGQRPTTPSQDPKDFDLSLPIPSRSSSMSKITHQDAVDESRDAKDNGDAMYDAGKDGNQGQTTEDINDVIRANIAILQRLKLKPAYDDFFDDDSSSTSFVTEFSDDETVDPLEQDLGNLTPEAGNPIRLKQHQDVTSGMKKEETNATIDVSKCPQTLTGQERGNPNAPKLPVGRHRPVSRTRSRSRSTSQQRSSSVCSHCCANNGALGSGVRKKDGRNAQSVSLDSNSGKNKKSFNPFPTTRKARPRTTKFGLYA